MFPSTDKRAPQRGQRSTRRLLLLLNQTAAAVLAFLPPLDAVRRDVLQDYRTTGGLVPFISPSPEG